MKPAFYRSGRPFYGIHPFGIFDRAFQEWQGHDGAFMPAVNVSESDTAFQLELVAPGRNKDAFEVKVDKDLLTVEYEQSTTETKEEGKYTRREFKFGAFKRSFQLPENVDQDQIHAAYENGVLVLTLPKKQVEALPETKTISIA